MDFQKKTTPIRLEQVGSDGYNNLYVYKQKNDREKKRLVTKNKKRWGKGSPRAMERVRSLELTVYHSINPERTIPA